MANGGVSVREVKKGSGVWHVFISMNDKRKSKKIGSKKLALEVASKIRARMLTGELQIEDRKKVFTFQEYALLWIENYIKPTRKPGTYSRYEEILRLYVNLALGDKKIDRITRGDIKGFLLRLHKKKVSRSTVSLCRDVMSGVLGQAVDDELILVNPVTGVLKALKLERVKKIPVEPLTFEEVDLFLTTCQKYVPKYYPLFLTACRTGMRLGELLALEWRDIDFNSHFIRVERSFKGKQVSTTKTGKARRVDMSDQLHEELKRLHLAKQQEAMSQGRDFPVNIIFHHQNGGHLSQNTVRNIFKRMLTKAEIRELRFHDLRHTFASLLLTNGESLAYVKEQLGHSSIQVTVDIYGHLIPGSNRNAVNRLDSTKSSTYMHMKNKNG